MSKRQPTLKEAQNLVNWGRLGRYWVKMKLSRNRKISKAELREMLTECLTAVMTEKPVEDD